MSGKLISHESFHRPVISHNGCACKRERRAGGCHLRLRILSFIHSREALQRLAPALILARAAQVVPTDMLLAGHDEQR